MNIQFWKHKAEKHVIKQECLNKLPIAQHAYYEQTEDKPTHLYDPAIGLLTGILVGEMLADSNTNNISNSDFVATGTTEQFSGTGGGDFGGGGSGGSFDDGANASSDYSAPDTSSYDSGSSFDSGIIVR